MVNPVQSRYTNEETSAWLRGLLTIAWADGHFDDAEKTLIADLAQEELTPQESLEVLEKISPQELAALLGGNSHTAENFLRTAVMVAIADGVYSQSEDDLLQQFCTALELKPDVLNSLRLMLCQISESSPPQVATPLSQEFTTEHHLALLHPVQEWLDHLDVQDPKVARFLCKMIPAQCPFERDVNLFGRTIAHIPALCKLNPLYDQLVGLRFRALSYLADKCGEDVTPYC